MDRWESNGKIEGVKMREYDIKQWEKMGKEGKMMRKTMEKRRDFDIKQWKKMGKQWKRWKEQGEGQMMSGMKGENDVE